MDLLFHLIVTRKFNCLVYMIKYHIFSIFDIGHPVGEISISVIGSGLKNSAENIHCTDKYHWKSIYFSENMPATPPPINLSPYCKFSFHLDQTIKS